MSTLSITGYYDDGISYAVAIDTEAVGNPLGVITMAPRPLLLSIESAMGSGPISLFGKEHDFSAETVEGVIAYLKSSTQVTGIEGDLPEEMTLNETPANAIQ